MELGCIGFQTTSLQPSTENCLALNQRRHVGPLQQVTSTFTRGPTHLHLGQDHQSDSSHFNLRFLALTWAEKKRRSYSRSEGFGIVNVSPLQAMLSHQMQLVPAKLKFDTSHTSTPVCPADGFSNFPGTSPATGLLKRTSLYQGLPLIDWTSQSAAITAAHQL